MKRQRFENAGLKLDKDRVLTYSQLSCPLDCEYCFVDDMNYNQKKNVAYLSGEQIELLKQLPEEINLIMLGCDTEFFQSKRNSIEILEELSDLNKDISVITKLSLSSDLIQKMKEVDHKLRQRGNFLTFSESIPCLDSSRLWEPRAPSPEKRIQTLRVAYENNLKTLVAIRLLLPTITDDELKKIISSTKDYCFGYYSGPLYLKNLEHPLLETNHPVNLKKEKVQPEWMLDDNIFYKIEKDGQMDFLKNLLQEQGKPFFEGAADAIKYLKTL